MKFEEVLSALREGKSINRGGSHEIFIVYSKKSEKSKLRIGTQNGMNWAFKITVSDLFAEDWQIVERH